MWAAAAGDIYTLKDGFDPSMHSFSKKRPEDPETCVLALYVAAPFDRTDVVRYLLSERYYSMLVSEIKHSRRDMDTFYYPRFDKDIKSSLDPEGRSPLHIAIKLKRPKVVSMLLQHGAPISSRWRHDSRSYLERAIISGNEEIVQSLLDHGASPSDPCSASGEDFPIHIAVKAAAPSMVSA